MTEGPEIEPAPLPAQGDLEKQCIYCKTHSLCNIHSPSNSGTCRTLSRILGSRGRSRFFERSESPRFKPGNLSPQPESESSNEDRQPNNNTNLSIGWRATIELSSFLAAITVFISTLVSPSLRQQVLWGLKYWEWALMVLVVLCHRLITVSLWIVSFLINLRFPLHLKVLNLVFGLKRTICNCIWIALVLLSWYLIFHDRIKKSACVHRISRILTVILVASVFWFFKIFLVRVLASNFYEGTFFDRMQERFFHHYILQALDSNLLTEEEGKKLEAAAVAMAMAVEEEIEGKDKCKMKSVSPLEKFASRRIQRDRLRRLMSHMKENGMSTPELDSHGTMVFWKTESKITSKKEAHKFATKIFEKVITASQKEEEEKEFIEKKDLLMFLTKGEVCMIQPLFKGHIQDGKIKKSAFQNWIVEAYGRHKKLDYALEDTKKVVKNLDRLANVFAVVIIIIISFIVMGVPINSVLLVSSSQLLLFGFIFQNSCKIMFESIIFVFVMHPFDIGDHCVIDGVQMIVEEMNILSTVFLGLNKDKIQYPNTELLTKTIINYNRSPDMGETIEIEIDVSTLEGPVEELWKSIKDYIASKPDYWHPKYQLLVKEIKDGSQMKVNLHVTHVIKFQNYLEKNNRRSDLYSGLKKSLETHKIKYHILPEKLNNEHSKKA